MRDVKKCLLVAPESGNASPEAVKAVSGSHASAREESRQTASRFLRSGRLPEPENTARETDAAGVMLPAVSAAHCCLFVVIAVSCGFPLGFASLPEVRFSGVSLRTVSGSPIGFKSGEKLVRLNCGPGPTVGRSGDFRPSRTPLRPPSVPLPAGLPAVAVHPGRLSAA